MKAHLYLVPALAGLAACSSPSFDDLPLATIPAGDPGSAALAASGADTTNSETTSCLQIEIDARNISNDSQQTLGLIGSASSRPASQGGEIIFWPAVFDIEGSDENQSRVASLRAEFDRLRAQSAAQNCRIRFGASR